jgi:hypothetical protein
MPYDDEKIGIILAKSFKTLSENQYLIAFLKQSKFFNKFHHRQFDSHMSPLIHVINRLIKAYPVFLV